MKARYAVWPVIIFSAVSLAGACSSDGGTGTDAATGGTDGTGEAGTGTNTGATSSKGGADDAGGMSTSDAGASAGGVPAANGGAAGAAGATGADLCEGKELDCPDDDNPCTEDECNPSTGECGIPRSETSCDDGVYCNGKDTCDAGECSVHDGNPCGGTCNEGGKYCECSTKEDCPADEPGEWSECAYASECVESAMKTRPVTKYTCNGVGKCVGAAAVEQEACTRETDGIACLDDGKRCNGAEKCKNGNCLPVGTNPCAGQDMPYCWESDPQCRACLTADNCQGTEICCRGTCQTTKCLPTITFVPAVQTAAFATK